jgi:4-amino-4-deoxy-L-arabinose transferase-like glycosyltransferase
MSFDVRRGAVALVAGALYVCLLLAAGWDDSATYDEPVHIFSGYLTNVWGNYQINSFHPPLVKSMAALPLCIHSPSFQNCDLDNLGRSVEVAKGWFWDNSRDPQLMLRESRATLYLFQATLLGVLLYLVAGLTGSSLAAVALGLLAFAGPALLGVSLYVTTDACLGLFLLLGLASYQRLERWGGKWNLALLTLATTGGLSSKHSFLLLPAVLLGLLLVRLVHAKIYQPAKARPLKILLGQVALASLLGFVLTLAFYGFCMRGMGSGETEQSLQRMARFGSPPFRAALSWTAAHDWLHPLGWYISGLNRANHYLANGWGIYTSVLGEVYQGGRWYYFPLILLSKESVGVSLLLLLVWTSAARSWIREPTSDSARLQALPAITLALTYLAIASQSSLNIGFRHIVPCYLCLLYATALILPRTVGDKANLAWLLLVLGLLRAWSLSLAFPHYLSYYNSLAGGVKHGYKLSVISDADWGQDLVRLGRLLRRRNATRTHLFYSATAEPTYYLGSNLVYDRDFRPGDLVAISTTFVQIPDYLDPESKAKVEKALTWPPIDQVGGSFLLFEVPKEERIL